MNILKNKKILITGGTGSIGETLVQKSLTSGAKNIRVFSNDENGLYEMELEYGGKNIEYFIGDIRNKDTINSVVKDIDIVFHTAALKHVDRCEMYPIEAVEVNILGTNNIIQASLNENVKKLISISTDKAVNPIGVMGSTKLLGEKLVSAAANKNHELVFSSVRFGNVLHSRGSILPRIEKQIKDGGPITLTDTRMKRFFMTKQEAVNLILTATEMARGGETFVLKMPVMNLLDLFEVMKEILAPRYNYKPSQIKTKLIGVRSGEKLLEDLMNDFEMETAFETKEFFIIPPHFKKLDLKNYPGAKKAKNIKKYFQNITPLDRKEILSMLKKVY